MTKKDPLDFLRTSVSQFDGESNDVYARRASIEITFDAHKILQHFINIYDCNSTVDSTIAVILANIISRSLKMIDEILKIQPRNESFTGSDFAKIMIQVLRETATTIEDKLPLKYRTENKEI